MLIEGETLTSRVGFFPEQDADFRSSLRDEILDYYGDEYQDSFYPPEQAGEAVAVYMLE